jgi:hypothetical protein
MYSLQILNARAALAQQVNMNVAAAALRTRDVFAEAMGCRVQDSTLGTRLHGQGQSLPAAR